MQLKSTAKKMIQSVIGLKNYLYFFAQYKISTLHHDPNERIIFSFRQLIPENSLILDIGANLGFVTYHLAQKPGCDVIAFEPIPTNYTILNRIVSSRQLTNVTIFACALGNENGQVQMVMPLHDGVVMQGLCHVVQEHAPETGYPFTVPVKRLDELVEIQTSGKRVGGIKIDAEDYEYFILKGGLQLLSQHKPVLCIELWDNDNRARSLALLQSIGYVPYRVEQNQLVAFSDWRTPLPGNNFICIPT